MGVKTSSLTIGGERGERVDYVYGAEPPVDNAAAIQRALALSAEISAPIQFPGGLFSATCKSTSKFYYANTRLGTYPALDLEGSNVWLVGPGAILRNKGRISPNINDVQPIIATDKNLAIDTLKNIGFSGIAFDMNNDGDSANSNQRAPYLMGIQGLKFDGTAVLSSGARRGSGPYLHNNRNIQITGHRHEKVTSGGNYRYNENLLHVGNIYYNYSEAVDLDGINWQVVVADHIFGSIDRTSQAIDANSVVNGVFANMAVKLTGQLININHKYTTPATFAQYVVAPWAANTAYGLPEKATNDSGKEYVVTTAGTSAGSGGPTGTGTGIVDGTVVWDYVQQNPSTVTPSQRVIVSNVVGEQIGSGTNPVISIGGQWGGNPHPGTRCEHDVIFNNFMFEDTSYLAVNEASNLVLDTFYMGDVIVPASAAALYMLSAEANNDQLAWSDLDAVIKYGTVKTSERGILRANNPRRIVIDHLRGSDLQTLGGGEADLHFTALHTRGAYIEIDGIDIPGNITINGDSTSIAAWAGSTAYVKNKIVSNSGKYYRCITSGTSAGAGGPTTTAAKITDGTCVWEWMPEPYTVLWGKRNQVRGSLLLQGDAHRFVHGETVQCLPPDIPATGTVTRTLYVAARRCYIAKASFTVGTLVAASAVNYRTVAIKSVRSGVTATIASPNTIAGWAAYVPVDAGFAASEDDARLESGDVIYLDTGSAGTGAALTGMCVSLEVLEH